MKGLIGKNKALGSGWSLLGSGTGPLGLQSTQQSLPRPASATAGR